MGFYAGYLTAHHLTTLVSKHCSLIELPSNILYDADTGIFHAYEVDKKLVFNITRAI